MRCVHQSYGLITGVLVSLIVLSGCASTPVTVASLPPAKYEKVGHATGEACGSFGILTPPLNFIPMGLNSRVETAYQRAIESVPGATSLLNVEYKEDWFWWVIGTTRCTTISGDAIKKASS